LVFAERGSVKGRVLAISLVALAALLGVGEAMAEAATSPGSAALMAAYQRVLADPADTAANLDYARLAEADGQPRKALATYERILLHDADNEEALAAMVRIRRLLQPDKTLITFETGFGYESNPLQRHVDLENSLKAYANAVIEDERRFGDARWRTLMTGNIEYFADVSDLDYGYLGGVTGPVLDVSTRLTVNPFAGGGVSMLDGSYYYSEAIAGMQFEGYLQGAYQLMRLRTGYRSFGDQSVSSDGFYADAIARWSIPAVASDDDVLVLTPHLRWSNIDGVDISPDPDDIIKPGRYLAWGGRVDYYMKMADWLTLGAGIDVTQTLYRDLEAPDGSKRDDVLIEPIASAVFNRALGMQTDLALDYRFQWNDSNDAERDFENHMLTARIITRF
jgi:hypothetical protein